MRELTVEMLVNSIHRATSLVELKRLVGPSVDDLAAEKLRIAAVRAMRKNHGPEAWRWPAEVAREYRRLLNEQEQHEALYGLDRDRASFDS